MKQFLLMVFLFFTIGMTGQCKNLRDNSFAADGFHAKLHVLAGYGVFPFANQSGYVSLKASYLDYGPGDEGLQLMAIGIGATADDVQVIIAPLTLYSGHLSVSEDFSLQTFNLEHGHSQVMSGISLSYSFN